MTTVAEQTFEEMTEGCVDLNIWITNFLPKIFKEEKSLEISVYVDDVPGGYRSSVVINRLEHYGFFVHKEANWYYIRLKDKIKDQ